jgi:uncharacterized protein Smg (DUF494 family)
VNTSLSRDLDSLSRLLDGAAYHAADIKHMLSRLEVDASQKAMLDAAKKDLYALKCLLWRCMEELSSIDKEHD